MMQWVLAATLFCGAGVFTSCSSDHDNPGPEQANKNRSEFINHTRQNLKELAENLNFGSWELANHINLNFNEHVLNNPEFEKTISAMFLIQCLQSIQPVEEGSELDQMGYKAFAIVDLTQFNYRFTPNEDKTGFDVEPAEDFEIVCPEMNPLTQKVEPGLLKLTLKAGGSSFLHLLKYISKEDLAVVAKIPTEFTYAIANKVTGEWKNVFTGAFKNDVKMSGQSQFFDPKSDTFTISGNVNSTLSAISDDMPGDATTINFVVGQDPLTHEANVQLLYNHNNKEMLRLEGIIENLNGMTNYTEFTNSMSIADAFVSIMAGNNIKQGTFTMLDDLTTEVKMSDCAKALQLQQAMARARRNYADQNTIDGYTQQLNEIISATMTCKHHSMNIPMQMQTVKFGVDFWSVPALNFADEKGYVPITELFDKESIEYIINIADHAAEPMQESLVVVRQLMQYIQSLTGILKEKEANPLLNAPI